MPTQKVSNDGFIVGAHESSDGISDGPHLARSKINAQLVRERDKIAASVTISVGKLGYELSYAGSGLSHDQLAFTDLEANLFFKGVFE
jgi:hypothetical protein